MGTSNIITKFALLLTFNCRAKGNNNIKKHILPIIITSNETATID